MQLVEEPFKIVILNLKSVMLKERERGVTNTIGKYLFHGKFTDEIHNIRVTEIICQSNSQT